MDPSSAETYAALERDGPIVASGQVLVDRKAMAQLDGNAEARAVEPQALNGFPQPTPVYPVTRPHTGVTHG